MSSYSVIKAAIKSSSFGNYLSINGANMASAVDLGAGSATTTKTIDATSTLYIEVYTNGIYAIRVPSTPGAYLRFDARDIAAAKAATDNGAGVVNCTSSFLPVLTKLHLCCVFPISTSDGSCFS